MILELGFWISLIVLFYIYFGYPIFAFILTWVWGLNIYKADIEPRVSVLIAAFNEEKDIERTILNKLSQDYPKSCLEIIIVSDGSDDRTDELIQNISKSNEMQIRFFRQEPRQGKTQALNMAVPYATGDILVFSDANSIYDSNAIRRLVRSFADSSVGYVTGQMIYTNSERSGIGEGSGTYMKYEHLLRIIETKLYSVVGVNGGIDAVRRELYTVMRSDQLPDLVLPLNVVEKGWRVVYEPSAKLYEPALTGVDKEFRMRVRVSLRAFWALYDKKNLLNPFRSPLFAWQLLSHKVLRYGAFVPLISLFICSALMRNINFFYKGFFIAQILFYGFSLLGHWLNRFYNVSSRLLIPYYFSVLNIACAIAFWKFLNGQKMVVWKPRQGN